MYKCNNKHSAVQIAFITTVYVDIIISTEDHCSNYKQFIILLRKILIPIEAKQRSSPCSIPKTR